MTPRLSRRALNRALLARQLLLDRGDLGATAAIEHLVGMQSQAPLAPYVGLWSRLADFQAQELSAATQARRVVRGPLFRATLHLVSTPDYLVLRPALAPMLSRRFAGSPFDIKETPEAELREAAEPLISQAPLTRAQLAAALGPRWPTVEPIALAQAVTFLMPVLQPPPRGVWGEGGAAAWVSAPAWLGVAFAEPIALERLIRRYLAAYGPASVKDVQSWSGLTRLRAVVEAMRPTLEVFTDDQGQELFDLPDAPRPAPDTPAPVRFLPEYDNVTFAHAQRSRIMAPGSLVPLPPGVGAQRGTVLIDGFLTALWSAVTADGVATLTVTPREPIADPGAVRAEGRALLSFLMPAHAEQRVEITAVGR